MTASTVAQGFGVYEQSLSLPALLHAYSCLSSASQRRGGSYCAASSDTLQPRGDELVSQAAEPPPELFTRAALKAEGTLKTKARPPRMCRLLSQSRLGLFGYQQL